ncbi:MAG: DUF4197 domain-containing protein [Betaproteobacteria bacterium]
MIRRQFTLSGLVAALAPQHRCWALGLRDLSDAEASKGLTTALETGALCAVGQLGRTDGFLANPAVRIPLPAQLDGAAKLLRTLGQGKQLDELVTTMNRAAESAVPMAKDMIVGAIKSMTVSDAKKILTGGETSATQFFAEKTRSALTLKFLPVITQSTQKLGLAEKYNRVAGKAAGLGLIQRDDASIEQYVTRKALDGLYLMIGEEEKKIRRDPLGTASAVLQRVFGALK